MQSLGRHVLAEVYGCQFEVLNDIALVENIMVNAALEAGASKRLFFTSLARKSQRSGCYFRVAPGNSYLAGLGYAAVDVFTCGESVNPGMPVITWLRNLGLPM